MVFGSIGALVHAIATVTFGVDHVVSGVAINIIAAGLVRYLSTLLYQGGSWPGPSQSPGIESISLNGLPVLSGGVRIIIRPSGTEAKMKCYIEAIEKDSKTAQVVLNLYRHRCST